VVRAILILEDLNPEGKMSGFLQPVPFLAFCLIEEEVFRFSTLSLRMGCGLCNNPHSLKKASNASRS
jgi:hypothetical protein